MIYQDITAQPWSFEDGGYKFVDLIDFPWGDLDASKENKILQVLSCNLRDAIEKVITHPGSCAFEISYKLHDAAGEESVISFRAPVMGDNFGFSFLGSDLSKGLDEAMSCRYAEPEDIKCAERAFRAMALDILAVCDKHSNKS